MQTTQQRTIEQWQLAPALLPAFTTPASQYTFVHNWQVHTMMRDTRTGHLALVASRDATLAECGKPWSETYHGHPDKANGRLLEDSAVARFPYGPLLWVGDLTYAQYKRMVGEAYCVHH